MGVPGVIQDFIQETLEQYANTYDIVVNTATVDGISINNAASDANDAIRKNEFDNHAASGGAHHTRYSDEEAQDATAALLSSGANINLTYDDAGNALTVAAPDEQIQDVVGAAVGTALVYDDPANAINVDPADDEEVPFGTGDDASVRYDATADDVRWRDKNNATDRLALDRSTGDLSISGALTEGAAL